MPFHSRPRSARRVLNAALAAAEQLEARVLLSAGALDTTFGGDGIVTKSLNRLNSLATVSVRPDGKIVVLGTAQSSGGFTFESERVMLRYNADGSLDESFGNNGVVTLDLRSGHPRSRSATPPFCPTARS